MSRHYTSSSALGPKKPWQGRGLKQKARAPETIDSSHGMRPSSEGRGRGGGQDGGIKTRNPALPIAKISCVFDLRAACPTVFDEPLPLYMHTRTLADARR